MGKKAKWTQAGPLVKVDGVVVHMDVVRDALTRSGAFSVRQGDWASEHGIDQGQVSRTLRGRGYWSGRSDAPVRIFRAFLKTCSKHGMSLEDFEFDPAMSKHDPTHVVDTDAGRVQALGPKPANAGTKGGSQANQPSGTTFTTSTSQQQQDDEDDEDALDDAINGAVQQAEAGDAPSEFPMSTAQQLGERIRKTKEDPSAPERAGMSPRKLAKWKGIYGVLREETDFNQQELVGGAYWLAAVYAETDDRQFLLETFQRVFGYDAEEPVGKLDVEGLQHPSEPFVRMFARRRVPVWAFGPTGCGKTHAEKVLALQLSRTGDYHRFQGDKDKNVFDFKGYDAAADGSTYVMPGPLWKAMEDGEPFVIDELTICDPAILMCLQAVLEGEPLYVERAERGKERIYPQPGFCILVGDNTNGRPDFTGDYAECNPINEAMRDRFVFVEFTHPDAETEEKIVNAIVEDDWQGEPLSVMRTRQDAQDLVREGKRNRSEDVTKSVDTVETEAPDGPVDEERLLSLAS